MLLVVLYKLSTNKRRLSRLPLFLDHCCQRANIQMSVHRATHASAVRRAGPKSPARGWPTPLRAALTYRPHSSAATATLRLFYSAVMLIQDGVKPFLVKYPSGGRIPRAAPAWVPTIDRCVGCWRAGDRGGGEGHASGPARRCSARGACLCPFLHGWPPVSIGIHPPRLPDIGILQHLTFDFSRPGTSYDILPVTLPCG